MPSPDPSTVFDAARISQGRTVMPTGLDTQGLRELGADVLARSVFTARGTNAIFVSKIKEVVDAIANGTMSEGQARTALWETLKATGYTPEGGFPDAPEGAVPPAVKGTLQDLSSFQRRDLIVSTQIGLMRGAGEKWRGHLPEALAAYPAWELIRVESRAVPRDWPSRWVISGGMLTADGRMIALKGDPVWGELGSYDNFTDALGVDHPPFAFRSGMGWRPVAAEQVRGLGITGPDGETPEEFHAGQPQAIGGKLPLPTPRLSLDGVDPALVDEFKRQTHAQPVPGKPFTVDYSDVLAREIAAGNAAYQQQGGAR